MGPGYQWHTPRKCDWPSPLIVLYINDLPDLVQNDVYLFADDTKIYSEIRYVNDCVSLQEDLDNLKTWPDTWLLALHPDKYKVLGLGNRTEETCIQIGSDSLKAHTIRKGFRCSYRQEAKLFKSI